MRITTEGNKASGIDKITIKAISCEASTSAFVKWSSGGATSWTGVKGISLLVSNSEVR
jgi:hypothetical protein